MKLNVVIIPKIVPKASQPGQQDFGPALEVKHSCDGRWDLMGFGFALCVSPPASAGHQVAAEKDML